MEEVAVRAENTLALDSAGHLATCPVTNSEAYLATRPLEALLEDEKAAAPGYNDKAPRDRVENPVVPAAAAVRRFSLISLYFAKLVLII